MGLAEEQSEVKKQNQQQGEEKTNMLAREATEHWIKVKTEPGMFSNEYTVLLTLADGKLVSFFADKILIDDSGNVPMLKVMLIKRDQKRKSEHVLLPIETFETATRWVEVLQH